MRVPDIDQTGDGAGAEPPKSVSSPPPSGRLSRGLRKSSKSRTRRPLSRHAHKYLHILLCSSRMLTTTHATRGGPSGGLNPGHPTPCSPLRARGSPPGTCGAGAVRGSAGGGASGSPSPPPGPSIGTRSEPRRGPRGGCREWGEKSSEHREDGHDPPGGAQERQPSPWRETAASVRVGGLARRSLALCDPP